MSKFWSEHFCPKNLCFLGAEPPKSDRKLKLSDFDEIWYPGVFEGADFKNRIHFYVGIIFSRSVVGFWGPLSYFPKSCRNRKLDRFERMFA